MSNGDFDPHSFGAASIGIAGVAAFSMMAGVQSAAHEISEVISDRSDAERFDLINDTIAEMRAENHALQKALKAQQAAYDAVFAGYKQLADLAVAQAEELQQLRAA
jgi:hypothetical protein